MDIAYLNLLNNGNFSFLFMGIISFILILFGGEPPFLILAIFFSGDLAKLFLLFFTGLLATIIFDIFWFFAPRSKSLNFLPEKLYNKCKKINKNFKNQEEKELFLFLLGGKFLFGTRIISAVSISMNKIKFKNFFKYSLLSSIIFSAIICMLGYILNRGYIFLRSFFESIITLLSISFYIILAIIIIRLSFYRQIKKRWEKRFIGKNKKRQNEIVIQKVKG